MAAAVFDRTRVSLAEPAASSFEYALQAVLLLNLADALLTSWWVANGWATEANPIMSRLLELGIGPFLLIKALVGITAVAVLKAYRRHLLSKLGVVAILVAYLAVFAFHVSYGATRLSSGTLISLVE